ncbi:acyl CoA:acetate/3-ketoacid CoA transferase [Roseivivax isoporae]|uniref:Acetate CoA-transferase YdiF n=1 Tax=Roseivivax isoporae LMG 25204 TaxID=1449351 RepID=X7F4U5_9RHOB|nr:CoA-transferase [Roseivivax isoporae]ETX27835.1 CoA transferase [Roseivivax isoporae LMG 25204]
MNFITAQEAASMVADHASLIASGSGGGHAVPEALLAALGERFRDTGAPRDLTFAHVVGIGDRKERGAAHLAQPGLVSRVITSALIDSPAFIPMALNDEIEAYTLPQGVLAQIMRDMAAGRPGLITRTGLHTFVDPRQRGGLQGGTMTEPRVALMEIDGEEWLRFLPWQIDVAFLRGTTADEDGNISMEQEAVPGEMLSTAQAVRRMGGKVIVQVKRVAKSGALRQRDVKLPGILVDHVVVVPEQSQTYATSYEASYAGELRVPLGSIRPLPFGARKIVARRAAMELVPGAVCNIGAGISTGISSVAAEEAVLDRIVLTNEQGFIGGAPLTGPDSGAAQNWAAMVDQPYQFDFYDGGGIDRAFLSFVEVNSTGDVNISRFNGTIVGIGGFVNISQNARETVFSGTFTAGGLEITCEDGALRIVTEGRHRKFRETIEQVSYSGAFAAREGRRALFVTERAVFRLTGGRLVLEEIAPGIDLEKDVLAHMDFAPDMPEAPRLMSDRLFRREPMGLAHENRFRSGKED